MLEKVDGCKPCLDEQGLTDLSGEDRFTKTSQSVVGRHAEESTIKQSMLGTILVILILSRPGGTDGVWAFRQIHVGQGSPNVNLISTWGVGGQLCLITEKANFPGGANILS